MVPLNGIRLRLLAAACAIVLAGGCAAPVQRTAAPIETRGAVEGPAPSPARAVPSPSPSPAVPGAPLPAAVPPAAPMTLARAAPAAPAPVPALVPAPRSPAVQSLFAAAMQSATRGDWDRAQAALERAIKLAPTDAGLWTELAYTHYRRGALEQAGQTAGRALSIARAQDLDPGRLERLIAEIETARLGTDGAPVGR